MDDDAILGQTLEQLSAIGGFGERLNALHRPMRGSRAAQSARRALGQYHTIFATSNLVSANDHVLAWRWILEAGYIPIGAHMTLLRGAVEGAATCRWLIDPSVAYPERIRRGAVLQLDDWRQRERFERAVVAESKRPWPEGPGKSGADRFAEHLARMRRVGLVTEDQAPDAIRPASMRDRVARYGSEPIWRLASAFAHSNPWSGMTLDMETTTKEAVPGGVRVKVTAKTEYALHATNVAIGGIATALSELEDHFGFAAN